MQHKTITLTLENNIIYTNKFIELEFIFVKIYIFSELEVEKTKNVIKYRLQ